MPGVEPSPVSSWSIRTRDGLPGADASNLNSPFSKISSNNKFCISYEKSKINVDQIIDYLKEQNIKIFDISTDDGDLEDVFLRLTKN